MFYLRKGEDLIAKDGIGKQKKWRRCEQGEEEARGKGKTNGLTVEAYGDIM